MKPLELMSEVEIENLSADEKEKLRERGWYREIGEVVMYGKTVLRYKKCYSCSHCKDYDTFAKRNICTVTKRKGNITRAYYCHNFSNK